MMEAYHSKMLQTNQQTGALNTAVSRLYFWSRRRRSHHECERFLRGQAVTSSLQHFPQCSWFFTAVTLATTERDRVKMYTTTYLHTNRPQTTKKQNRNIAKMIWRYFHSTHFGQFWDIHVFFSLYCREHQVYPVLEWCLIIFWRPTGRFRHTMISHSLGKIRKLLSQFVLHALN